MWDYATTEEKKEQRVSNGIGFDIGVEKNREEWRYSFFVILVATFGELGVQKRTEFSKKCVQNQIWLRCKHTRPGKQGNNLGRKHLKYGFEARILGK